MTIFHPSSRGDLIQYTILAVLVTVTSFIFVGHLVDDSYITFRYARNLVDGYGLQFNPGMNGEPVEGYTNFSWVMISAIPHVFGLEDMAVLWWARIISLFAAFGLAVGTMKITSHLGASKNWAFVAGCAMAVHPTVGIYVMSGLETIAFAALFIWSIERMLANRPKASLWLAVATCLTRPEGHLVLLIVIGTFVVRALQKKRLSALIMLAKIAMPMLLLLAIYHGFRYSYFGSLLPNTFLVKNGGGAFLYDGIRDVEELFAMWINPVLTILALFVCLLLRRWYYIWMTLLGLFFLGYLVWVGGDEMKFGRLVTPTWPLLVAVACAGLHVIFRDLWKSAKCTLPYVVGAAFVAITIPTLVELRTKIADYQENIQVSQAKVGNWLQTNLPARSKVVHQDVGVAPYHAHDINWIDTIGLVDRQIAHLRQEEGVAPKGTKPRDNEKTSEVYQRFRLRVRDYIMAQRPEAIILVAYVPPDKFVPPAPDTTPAEKFVIYRPHFQEPAHGLPSDPRFREGYILKQTYRRSEGCILVLFMRQDLMNHKNPKGEQWVVSHEPTWHMAP